MLMRSEVAAGLIQPVMFLRRGQTVSERDLPAAGLGAKVVAGSTCNGLDMIGAGAAIE